MSKYKSLEGGELYTVGWIAALAKELTAALAMLDERHGTPNGFKKPFTDSNSYHWGRIGQHNIVLVSLAAGMYGTTSAATTAIHMLSSFPSIKVGLMVGIGAGIARPKQKRDIRLGDIAVSLPHGQSGGVLQYDLGKIGVSEEQGHTTHIFKRVGFLNSPPEALLKALTSLRAHVRLQGSKVSSFLEETLERYPQMAENEPDEPGYIYQGHENDKFFEASYIHKGTAGCDDCDPTRMVTRDPRNNPSVPRVHYGVIASGNKLVKDAVERDLILRESGEDCICLEMEAAGLMNSFPCLVVRGICDYADSHKNDEWQEYAAATAAAYAKEFLEFVDTQDLAQTTRAIDILQNISGSIVELATHVRDTGETVQELRQVHRESDIRDWLSAPNSSINYTDALGKRHEGTGLWFTDGQLFTNWKKRSNSFLWLHGIPGCGKTVLTSSIIEHLNRVTTPVQVLLYFYFDSSDTNKQTLESMLRSLVSQLYQSQPDSRGPLHQLWGSPTEGSHQLSTKSLKDVLLAMLGRANDVSIVLDALDESTTRNDLLAWLRDVSEDGSFAGRILVTARREEGIESALQRWMQPQDRISMRQSHVNGDIRRYVHDTVHESKELERWSKAPEVQNEIKTGIVKKADGMFRWAACQMDALKNCLDYRRLRQVLIALPKTLDETYARILENIPDEHSTQAARILNLLIWSDRTFKIDELVDAIATNLDEEPGFVPRNRMPVPRDVLKLCSSLVTVSWNRRDSSRGIVRLAHSSVKEYLVSNHVSQAFQGLINETVARSYLARLCLTYIIGVSLLSLPNQPLRLLRNSEVRSKFPFIRYSVRYWMIHARKVMHEDESLCEMAMNFFLERPEAFSLFKKMYSLTKLHEEQSRDTGPLWFAARGGLERMVERLINTGADIDAQDGAALMAAWDNGEDTVVQSLIKKGADINTRGGQLLAQAMESGRETTVQLLLDKGATLNLNSKSKRPALQELLESSYEKLVALLAEGSSRAAALELPSLKPHLKIVRILLDKGTDMNFRGNQWLDTLRSGGWSVQNVQRILQHDSYLKSNHLLSALFDADPQAEKILLVMLPYLTLEIAAPKQTRPCTVSLSHAVAPRSTRPSETMLHHAADRGSEILAQKCLDLGVDVHTEDRRAGTALHYAARRGHLAVVKMLVGAGADIKALGFHGQTPLACAKQTASDPKADKEAEAGVRDVIAYLSAQDDAVLYPSLPIHTYRIRESEDSTGFKEDQDTRTCSTISPKLFRTLDFDAIRQWERESAT